MWEFLLGFFTGLLLLGIGAVVWVWWGEDKKIPYWKSR